MRLGVKMGGTRVVTFESDENFINFLLKLNKRNRYIRKVLEHEKEHLNKARELGYDSQLAVVVWDTMPPILLAETIEYVGAKPTLQDQIKIALAPQKPSKADYRLARGLGEKLKC